jgi:ABC-type multidrug transport system ATPase subunit
MPKNNSLVDISNLSKVFINKKKHQQALGGISFSIGRGELVGYLGPNGAGKTTTVKILLGLLRPTGGTANVYTRRLGFVLDVPSLYSQLTLRDNIHFYSKFLGVPLSRALDRLAQVGMSAYLDGKVGTFSLGMRKRVELARALLNEPELLLLDEPMSGLDPTAQVALREILKEQMLKGVSMLVASHDLYNMQLLGTRFIFLKSGQIVSDVPASSVASDHELESFYHNVMGE